MTRNEVLFDALSYHRNVGATLNDLREYARFHGDDEKDDQKKTTPRLDLAILHGLKDAELIYQVGDKWFLTSKGFGKARGRSYAANWQSEDAWVLLSLLHCGRDEAVVDLMWVIASADFINHDLPSMQSMHGALNRLRAGGLIGSRDGGFYVTKRALRLLKKVEATCRNSVHSILDGLQRILACPCCGVTIKIVRWPIRLSEDKYRDAVRAYHHMVKSIVK